MKRPIVQTLIFAAALIVAACGERPAPAASQAPANNGWVMPPVIDAVTPAGSDLKLSGHASPLGRVVISGPGNQAYAVGADQDGRFDLRIPRPSRDTLFTVEARVGQLGYPAPYRLLVAADPAGPIGLLSVGAPARRLDSAGPLDALDSDGSSSLLSGRGGPDAVVEVEVGAPHTVRTGPDGRWSLALASVRASAIRLGSVVYAPPSGAALVEGVLERAGAGWRITWSTPGGGRQTTWFPDRG